MSEDTCYRIVAPNHDYELCRAKTLNKLFETFCKTISEHNLDVEEINQKVVDEASFDDARGSFHLGDWKVEEGRIEEKMVFDD